MAKTSVNTEQKQKPQLYKPGQSGNLKGRPKGSRNKLGEALPVSKSEHFNATYKNSQDKRGLLYSLELTQ